MPLGCAGEIFEGDRVPNAVPGDAKEVGGQASEGLAYGNTGNAHRSQEDFSKAIELLTKDLMIIKQLDNRVAFVRFPYAFPSPALSGIAFEITGASFEITGASCGNRRPYACSLVPDTRSRGSRSPRPPQPGRASPLQSSSPACGTRLLAIQFTVYGSHSTRAAACRGKTSDDSRPNLLSRKD
jgi:hypothetical protein